jgi:hypothetical protein
MIFQDIRFGFGGAKEAKNRFSQKGMGQKRALGLERMGLDAFSRAEGDREFRPASESSVWRT